MSAPLTIHHLALGARDVATLASFYRFALGLPERARHHRPDGTLRSIWLALGEGEGAPMLMVEADETGGERAAPSAKPEPGWFLIALRARGDAHRRELEGALERAGSPVEARTAATSYARDPEGNRVAISVFCFEGA